MDAMMMGLRLPMIELREMGSSIEVILISGLKKNFMLYEVITILEEEGAEVVSASFSTVGDKVFHTVHAQSWCGDFKGLPEIAGTDLLELHVKSET
ncbi:hypothetical protein GH714_030046 [Hevea brasiliensis]|uniref:Uncharacterized protein n=1 Tax=Hevea brasiliensis TaxID=3981 RepID=A0A6A6MR83_HEVBR|nr:hypothetical protein GH714_030046 [Hevea brasiliensis]